MLKTTLNIVFWQTIFFLVLWSYLVATGGLLSEGKRPRCRHHWMYFAPKCLVLLLAHFLPNRIFLKACLNSGLKMVYMIGFNVELKQPNHRDIETKYLLKKSALIGNNTAIMKNGNQHRTKAPVMIARVFAAFLSRLESIESRAFLRTGYWKVWYVGPHSVVVGSSWSMSLVFSGLLFDDTVVNAVVVSEIVGRGRPMTVTTAAAIPPTKEKKI